MRLCVDVGNTTIRLGFYENGFLRYRLIMATDANKLEDDLYSSLEFLCRQRHIPTYNVDNIIYSSVVPNINKELKKALEKLFTESRLINLESCLKYYPVQMNCDNPKEVGADIIADIVGAKSKYNLPLIIVDLGTATKLLYVDKEGIFQSALIMPGLKISADSLFDKAALLPEVDLENATNVSNSKNTNDCIRNGIVFGHVESIKGLCNRFEEEVGHKVNVVVTGGAASLVLKHLPKEYLHDDSLVLDGELILLEKYLDEIGD